MNNDFSAEIIKLLATSLHNGREKPRKKQCQSHVKVGPVLEPKIEIREGLVVMLPSEKIPFLEFLLIRQAFSLQKTAVKMGPKMWGK